MVGEGGPVGGGQRLLRRVFPQVVDRTSEVAQHQVRHIAAETKHVRQHRVGGRFPAVHAQSIREIEQAVARIAAVLDDP